MTFNFKDRRFASSVFFFIICVQLKMEFLSTLLATNEYFLNNHHCRHIIGASISEIESKCTSLFGYQPTYRELIEKHQEDGIRLFDRFNVDLCFKFGSCTDNYQHSIFSGICQLMDDTALEVKWMPKLIRRVPL